ncbi:MAG: phosphodiesterase [Micrococcales bacterium]|nr:phosphodiesterase [Micrococcales bacterium]
MRVISHRGWWLNPAEKNTRLAFERSFAAGFATETDIRDDGRGGLVISHDPPTGGEMTLGALLELASAYALNGPMALNIKADGLASAVAQELARYPQLEAFVFDMSVPDTPAYFAVGVDVFARRSEVEPVTVWPELVRGVWLDAFEEERYTTFDLEALLADGPVCVVSSELHGRDPKPLWTLLRPLVRSEGLILCTDLPDEAARALEVQA